jgi:glycosyltransferase involved in cell wall biosynthesis
VSPKVSIVVLSYFHPEVTKVCLDTLRITDSVDYEVVVVDNGSDEKTVHYLRRAQQAGLITKLIENDYNAMFSEGNNIGVRASDQGSEYVLLLNSDVGFMRPDWLEKLVGWAEGTTLHYPSIWPHHPTVPAPGPYDVVSLGWSWDNHIKNGLGVRPEGWCCLYRRSVWQDMSPEFPWLYGLDLQITTIARGGGRVGVLSQYGPYLRHREGGSTSKTFDVEQPGTPDLPGWYDGVHIESLDFTLGPNEHDSYLWW